VVGYPVEVWEAQHVVFKALVVVTDLLIEVSFDQERWLIDSLNFCKECCLLFNDE
jgi:hypothetical protein